MRNVFVTEAGRGPQDAYVGPYWFVRDSSGNVVLKAHRCTLADAEQYGDFLTCPHGLCEVWESWRTDASRDCSLRFEAGEAGGVERGYPGGKVVHGDGFA
jgi:hypothetical protein